MVCPDVNSAHFLATSEKKWIFFKLNWKNTKSPAKSLSRNQKKRSTERLLHNPLHHVQHEADIDLAISKRLSARFFVPFATTAANSKQEMQLCRNICTLLIHHLQKLVGFFLESPFSIALGLLSSQL